MTPRRARPDGASDDEIVAGLLRGDPLAWRYLCETYAGPLYVYAYHRTGRDGPAAEDIRQETLLAAVESISSYRRQVPLFSWLCGIARHKAADETRRHRRETASLDSLDEDGTLSAKKDVSLLLGKEPLPEELVERAETRAAVVEALWRLPADHRAALVNRYARGKSVADTAGLLGRSYKATESLLSRARDAFRRSLMEVESDDKRRTANRPQRGRSPRP